MPNTIQASNATELSAALNAAGGGDTIVLADGNYGTLDLRQDYSSTVTIQAANEGGANFTRVELRSATNIAFDGIDANYASTTSGSSNISFSNGTFSGMYFRDATGVNVTNNDISGGEHALILNDVVDFVISDNEIHHAESDLMRITGSSANGLIENNFLHDVAATPPQHPDMIQVFGVNGVNPTNLRITGNVIYDNPETGSVYAQGIFISGPQGEAYSNITVDNNMVAVGSPNSIFINGGQKNVLIENNTLIPWEGQNGGVIRLTINNGYSNEGVTVRDNIARRLLDETGNSDIYNNFFYGSSDTATLAELFNGLGETWRDFLPQNGSPIDLSSGLGAAERLLELLGENTGSGISVPPEPEPQPTTVSLDTVNGVLVLSNGATDFSSSADVIEMDLGAQGALDTGTIAFTFDADTLNGSRGLVSRDAYGSGDHFTSYIEGGSLFLRFQNETETAVLEMGGVSANTSYDVHATFGGGQVRLFVNGSLIDQAAFDMSMSQSAEFLQIGANGWASGSGAAGFTNVFDGTISDVLLTSGAMTPSGLEALLGGSGTLKPPVVEPVPDPIEANVVYCKDFIDTRSRRTIETVAPEDLPDMTSGTIGLTFNMDDVQDHSGLVARDAYGAGNHFVAYVEDGTLNVRYQNSDSEVTMQYDRLQTGVDYDLVTSFGNGRVTLHVNGTTIDTQSFQTDWVGGSEYLVVGATNWASDPGSTRTRHVAEGDLTDFILIEGEVDADTVRSVVDDQLSLIADDIADQFAGTKSPGMEIDDGSANVAYASSENGHFAAPGDENIASEPVLFEPTTNFVDSFDFV